MISCIHCEGVDIRKNGKLASGGQRRKCLGCNTQFSTGGIKKTYSGNFKYEVTMNYIHKGLTAREVIERYHISSRTLLKWAKIHKEYCPACD